jgi:heptosyltransferase-2/heptosyltransferase-3
VLRPDHLGDVLLSRPALELLRAALPTAEITAVVGPWAAPSLQGLDVRVATFPFPGFLRSPARPSRWPARLAPYAALLALAARLRRERYDAALVLRPDHWWGALACAVAGVPLRVGHATPDTASLLTHAIRRPPTEHATETAVAAATALLGVLGVTAPAPGPGPVRFVPSGAAQRAAHTWLAAHRASRGWRVALHPGAGAGVKTWPPHRWAAVVNALAGEADIVLTGGPDEGPLVDAVAGQACARPPVAQGLSWDGLAALFQQVDLVLGMDSGPLHLATAVGTPTVRIYGPTDPRIYGPAGDGGRHRVLQGDLACQPCGNLIAPPCGYRDAPPCLAAVSIEAVVAAARAALAGACG